MTTRPFVTDARLATAISRVRDEISRTDTKAGILLTALGLPLAALVATVPGHHASPVATALLGIGALGLLTAMLVVLLVVRPRITGAPRDLAVLQKAADAALYDGKHSGRAHLATAAHTTTPSINGRRMGRPGTAVWGPAA